MWAISLAFRELIHHYCLEHYEQARSPRMLQASTRAVLIAPIIAASVFLTGCGTASLPAPGTGSPAGEEFRTATAQKVTKLTGFL
jgi:hypothetical protein